MKDIIILGCGGHANSCIEILESEKKFNVLGLICKTEKKKYSGYKILGNDKKLKLIKKKCKNALIGVGQIKNYQKRLKLFNILKKEGYNLPKIVSKYYLIYKKSKILEGTIIMKGVIINKNVQIGKNCIINTGAIIEHDAKVGSNSHISTGVILNGGSTVGNNCFIGSGSVINENINIPDNQIIPSMTKVTTRYYSKKKKK